METIIEVGDALKADHAVKLAKQNRILLWRGDFRNALQLLAAMKRRLSRVRPQESSAKTFHNYRKTTARRAHLLSRVQVDISPDFELNLPSTPDVSEACKQAFGQDLKQRMPLTEILGALGAQRWRTKGVHVHALGHKIYPHYGVFAPTRQEYIDLVANAPWPNPHKAFDIGTGTGVLAALLAKRGAESVVAVDIEQRSVDCAHDNVTRLNLGKKIQIQHQDLFPTGKADLVVCNPPWLPGEVSAPLDAAIYDPDSRMLRGFLDKLPEHLTDKGEAWLIVSDLAERLGLRTTTHKLITQAGLETKDQLTIRPRHKARPGDPLAEYRAAEITSLWRITL
ncbi:class I SAM-dependent methyltransferase [Kibdelosporangium philippinense]|uniref:Class I SAM-dependent methyltransferase n=1 Tax=Kibdelosporangium philippinense TaxID=211113 RepID=A0ABS8ZUX8_9PSEU|nr:class I SAM-dependent methyltransferase [Kibdelosporangium philippinense]MCE7010421.1 class I SAM-dependent methyltransferase [Kibdelosporangium philippinense]